ncbi:glycosyltransferase [Silvibacterium sp.]|uniref:glycosyltransferase n=1 Tax=Silvibacterium sp. TaxID=1964179 RepID=UPI0039E4BE55
MRRSLEVPNNAILLTGEPSVATRIRKRLYWWTWVAPLFHRRVADVKADLIHAHFGPDGITAAHIADRLQLPLIVTLHGYDVTISQRSNAGYEYLWKRASAFLCVSQFIRERAIRAGFPPEKLRVHSIGIDLKQFRPEGTQAKRNSVLFVSRLVQKKGCEYLLRAMALVQKQRPDVELTIIGDGALRPRLTELAKSLGVRCLFMGSQPGSVIRKELRAARVFCVPSVTADNGDSEGLGMVFAEAQAMGVPVASFEHGGIPEVVRHGEGGLLAPEGNIAQLAENLLLYLNDDDIWSRSRERGMAWVAEQFDIDRQTRELEAIYDEVVNGGVNHMPAGSQGAESIDTQEAGSLKG